MKKHYIILNLKFPKFIGRGWQWGEEENLGNLVLCLEKMPWRKYCVQPPCGQMNPVNENVFMIMEKIYEAILAVQLEGATFHVGGDEVGF